MSNLEKPPAGLFKEIEGMETYSQLFREGPKTLLSLSVFAEIIQSIKSENSEAQDISTLFPQQPVSHEQQMFGMSHKLVQTDPVIDCLTAQQAETLCRKLLEKEWLILQFQRCQVERKKLQLEQMLFELKQNRESMIFLVEQHKCLFEQGRKQFEEAVGKKQQKLEKRWEEFQKEKKRLAQLVAEKKQLRNSIRQVEHLESKECQTEERQTAEQSSWKPDENRLETRDATLEDAGTLGQKDTCIKNIIFSRISEEKSNNTCRSRRTSQDLKTKSSTLEIHYRRTNAIEKLLSRLQTFELLQSQLQKNCKLYFMGKLHKISKMSKGLQIFLDAASSPMVCAFERLKKLMLNPKPLRHQKPGARKSIVIKRVPSNDRLIVVNSVRQSHYRAHKRALSKAELQEQQNKSMNNSNLQIDLNATFSSSSCRNSLTSLISPSYKYAEEQRMSLNSSLCGGTRPSLEREKGLTLRLKSPSHHVSQRRLQINLSRML